MINVPNIALHLTRASKLFRVFKFRGGRGPLSFALGVCFIKSPNPNNVNNHLNQSKEINHVRLVRTQQEQ